MTKYCIDTHALVWYFTGQTALSRTAKKGIDAVFAGRAQGYLSIIVLLELLHMSFKRPSFAFSRVLGQLRRPQITIVPLDKIILTRCYRLPQALEIHDRIIAATTQATGSVLITKDPVFGRVSTLCTLW